MANTITDFVMNNFPFPGFFSMLLFSVATYILVALLSICLTAYKKGGFSQLNLLSKSRSLDFIGFSMVAGVIASLMFMSISGFYCGFMIVSLITLLFGFVSGLLEALICGFIFCVTSVASLESIYEMVVSMTFSLPIALSLALIIGLLIEFKKSKSRVTQKFSSFEDIQ